MSKPLRDTMPITAAWIDALREEFGKEHIDDQIRAALKDGAATFHAIENGHELGRPVTIGNRWA